MAYRRAFVLKGMLFLIGLGHDTKTTSKTAPFPRNHMNCLLFLLLVLLVCLILFNLLIAIITNGFDDASANAKARVLLMRARLICNFEADLDLSRSKLADDSPKALERL